MAIKVYRYKSHTSSGELLRAIVDFVYPRYCAGCAKRLSLNEYGVCPSCFLTFPRFVELTDKAWERLQGTTYPIQGFLGGYRFEKLNRVQAMIHNVKYHRHAEAAVAVGRSLALELGICKEDFDLIIPVPITRQREAKRGYNQSSLFAQGISMATQIPVAEHGLKRSKDSESQTTRSRKERLQAMKNTFQLGVDSIEKGSRILLLDDVLTTGATLVAAADTLTEAYPQKIVLMAVAVDV